MIATFAFLLSACSGRDSNTRIDTTDQLAFRPNLLILIADDIGVEQFANFGIGSSPALTATIDALGTNGISFSHVWSQPLCSPTRATLLTGRYGFRSGVDMTQNEGVQVPHPDLPESVNMLYGPESYYSWQENVNGKLEHRTGYTPSRKVDDAIAWLDDGAFAVRDDRFRLIRWHDREELYDLESDPYESDNLLADGVSKDEQEAIDRLALIVNELRGQ